MCAKMAGMFFSINGRNVVMCVSFLAVSVLLSSCMGPATIDPTVEARMGLESADSAMGDWEGSWELNDGSDSGPLVSQVIALGKGQYKAKIMSAFDTREEPIAVLEGQRDGAIVRFEGSGRYENNEFQIEAVIKDGQFTGTFTGDASGKVALER